jgi:hypothetical protein
MGSHYTAADMLKLVTKLQTFVGSTRALVDTGAIDIGDAKATVADLMPAAKSLDDLRAELHSLANSLRRTARIILVVDDLGKTTGEAVDPTVMISKCHPEDLDYLVALREAQRNSVFDVYFRCREVALGRDPDVGDEADNGLENPGVPGDPDPPKPYDYR